MPYATTTLSTTTLAAGVSSFSDTSIKVASTTGISKGIRLYLDRELMNVLNITSSDTTGTWINVQRGVDGTHSARHSAGSTITIGRADQFYSTDPQGMPPQEIVVSPHINVLTGDFWVVAGDDGVNPNRWWAKRPVLRAPGALGVRTETILPNAASPATTTQNS